MHRDASDSKGGASPKRKASVAHTEPPAPATVVYITEQEEVPGITPSPYYGGHAD